MRKEFAGFKWSCLVTVIILAIGLNISFVSKLWSESSESNDKPAVSKINAKVDGGYGNFDSNDTYFGTATATFPLGHRFGASVDGLGGNYSANSLWGAGGSLFWRNPDKGLLGIAGNNIKVGAINGYRGGVTGELYFDKFSILADAGYLGADTIDAGVYGELQLRWYPIDNLALGAGSAYANSIVAGLVNLEYMPAPNALPGLTLFADGGWGNEGYHSVMGGIRYYFGGTGKTLKAKHREDDPPNQALQGLMLCTEGDCFRPKPEEVTPDDIITDVDVTDDTADDVETDIAPPV